MKVKTVFLTAITAILTAIYTPATVFAQSLTCKSASGAKGINTALGCIPAENTNALSQWILSWGMGIAGGIGLLSVAWGAVMIMTSAGDPAKVQAGKALLTAAVTGILFLVFGALILKIVGVDILGINFTT